MGPSCLGLAISYKGWKTLSPGFCFSLCHPLAVGLWTSHLMALNLSFFLCELGQQVAGPPFPWVDVGLFVGKA